MTKCRVMDRVRGRDLLGPSQGAEVVIYSPLRALRGRELVEDSMLEIEDSR
jgi:hypothetical protein